MKATEEKQRFALRKLSIGTVSVLVGVLALGFSASDQVKADSGDAANQTQAVTQVEQQPSQKAAESMVQSSDSKQAAAPAEQQTTSAQQQAPQQQASQQPVVATKDPSSKSVSTDPVTETKTITRTIDEIRFTVNWKDASNGDTIRTIYTANYKRTKSVGTDGQTTYSEWTPDGSHVTVYDLNTQQQISESTNMLPLENGQYVFPAYVLKGTPRDLLKNENETYQAIVNYTTGKNVDGSYNWVTKQALTTADVPGETVNPNTSVDSKVEIEYLAGFQTNSNWIYNRRIFDQNPKTGTFETVEQGTNIMTRTWQEDPRPDEPGSYTFTGDSVPEYVPKHADQYIPYVLVYKNNGWQPISGESIPAKSFTNYEQDILPEVNNFNHGEFANAWTQSYEIVYIQKEPETLTKPVKETIHYVFENGAKAKDDNVQTVTLSKKVQVYAYKNTPVQNPDTIPWSTSEFDAVQSPAIKGYTPDILEIAAQSVNGDTKDLDFTVKYKKNDPTPQPKPQPSEPNATQPTQPNPTQPSEPNATQPTQPNPTQPTEPSNATQPTQPNPTQPTEPSNPTQPNPTQPTEPNNPTSPTQPTQPKGQTSETPKQPDQPTEPTQPTQPKGQTSEPTPDVPQTPENPTSPAVPETPTDNVIPGTPAEPAQPVAEKVPVEPQQPKAQNNKLPQTGNSKNAMSILGLAAASALAMLGLGDKRQHD